MPNQPLNLKTSLNPTKNPTSKTPVNKGGIVIAGLLLLLAVIYTAYLGFLATSAGELKTDMTSWAINSLITLVLYVMAYRSYKTAKANQQLMTNPYLPAQQQSSLLPKPLLMVVKVLGTLFFLMVATLGLINSDWLLLGCGVAFAGGIHVTGLQQKYPKVNWVGAFVVLIGMLLIIAGIMGRLA